MKTLLAFTLSMTLLAAPGFAQTDSAAGASATPASGKPDDAELMKQMMELAKTNDNHKLLTSLDGSWSYVVKMWVNGDSNGKPMESKGTAVRKSMMDGHFVMMDVTGKTQMPGPDGKLKETTFLGKSIEGYDNVKKKFVGSWIDNMGTGIMMSEGDYDPATKKFTYTGEEEMAPGMKLKITEFLTVEDKDHMKMEWMEDRGGQQVKTMEIDYARKK